ncbi:MAG TPA: prepilin-type N-terminal cleavage/methylation domain-containing protein [Gemmatimonadaceae bacterium]|nr:prepilin-type N-terminal cleavage/methylation domain-containing protein [Gemmatimonadaceae bacterium]
MKRGTRKGFTLIELLIVVVIIGILAAIAIPKFANTKDKAYLAAVKTDLRNLATAQEGYFADNQIYTSSMPNFTPSANVTLAVANATANGWEATGTNSAMSTVVTCTIKVGSQATAVYIDGIVKCN